MKSKIRLLALETHSLKSLSKSSWLSDRFLSHEGIIISTHFKFYYDFTLQV